MDHEFFEEMKAKGLFGGKAPADENEDSEKSLALPDRRFSDDSGKGKTPDTPKETLTEPLSASFSEELPEIDRLWEGRD